MPEYLESLKEIDEGYFNNLYIGDNYLELPDELADEDKQLNKEELEAIKANRALEELENSIDAHNINSYSEINVARQNKKFEAITAKQEINPDNKITSTENLADMIPEIKQKGFVRVGVVYSDKVEGANGRFSFVGIDEKGKISPIDSLQNIQGTTTGQKVTSINSTDGSSVEEEQVAGIVTIQNGRNVGNGMREGLSVRIGNYGIIEVDYVREELGRDKENRFFSAPIETQSIKPTTKEVREFMDKTRNVTMDEELDRATPEIGRDGDARMQNIDDTTLNDDFDIDEIIELKNGGQTTLRQEAAKAKVSPEEFKRKYESAQGKTPDEKIEGAHEEIEEDFIPDKKVGR